VQWVTQADGGLGFKLNVCSIIASTQNIFAYECTLTYKVIRNNERIALMFKASTILLAAMALLPTPAFAGDLVIDLTGIQAGKGDLYVGLQTKDQFLKDAGVNGAIIKVPASGNQQVVLKNVAPGDYSVSVWHDSDGDSKFSMAANGMPADGWSMHNAQALRGAPQWDQVKFSMTPAGVKLQLAMIYPK
jgi:uncharacterized protein (DUF2141 family)